MSGRRFATFAAAALVFVVNEENRVLVLRTPASSTWQIVNGAVERGETIAEAALREVAEEAGSELRVELLGLVHAYTFRYDDAVLDMISLFWAAAYKGGPVQPGDDMLGSEVWWASLEELDRLGDGVVLIPTERWLFERAVRLAETWRGTDLPLQLEPGGRRPHTRN